MFSKLPNDLIIYIFSFCKTKSNLQFKVHFIIQNYNFFICLPKKSIIFKKHVDNWNLYIKLFMKSISDKDLVVDIPNNYKNNGLYIITSPIKICHRWEKYNKPPFYIEHKNINEYLYKLQICNLKFKHFNDNTYMIYHDSTIEHINYHVSNKLLVKKYSWSYNRIDKFALTIYQIGNNIMCYNSFGLVNKDIYSLFSNFYF